MYLPKNGSGWESTGLFSFFQKVNKQRQQKQAETTFSHLTIRFCLFLRVLNAF